MYKKYGQSSLAFHEWGIIWGRGIRPLESMEEANLNGLGSEN